MKPHKFLFDTNALLHNPHYLEEVDGTIFIPLTVLKELDKIKSEFNTERGFKARNAVRKLKSLSSVEYGLGHVSAGWIENNDDSIVQFAVEHETGIVTGDFLMQLKSKAKFREYFTERGWLKGLSENEVNALLDEWVIEANNNDDYIRYTGVEELLLNLDLEEDKIILASIYEGNNPLNLLNNQYLILKDTREKFINEITGRIDYKMIDVFRWTGQSFEKLLKPPKNLKGKTIYQDCAIDLLMNKNIPIKIIAGTYGSGKTFLAMKAGLHHVREKGTYAKIVAVRNPIGSGEEIGFLPGDKSEKIGDFFRPIVQYLDRGEFELAEMTQRGQLECEIPFYMKGLSIPEAFIIVDEAEDLDVKTLKLIGTRLAVNSAIVFSGDYKQAEGKYLYDNGLLKMIDKLKGNSLVGIVVLPDDVRSEASKVFADM